MNSHRSHEKQRHRLTVLFTDICGSTAISRSLEMEEFDELLESVRSIWRQAADLHGGFIPRMQGDGALMLFGFPDGDETAGRRAVDAALQIHEQVQRIVVPHGGGTGAPIRAHSAIHAGLVLLSTGDVERGRVDVAGPVVNAAGKLGQFARPGSIVATESALGPYAGHFQMRSADVARQAAGLLEPVFEILGRQHQSRRYDATARRGMTPLLGRAAHLRSLAEFTADPRSRSTARCIVVQAAAGLGKTRLLEELVSLLAPSRWTIAFGTCESGLGSEALQPFLQVMRSVSTETSDRPERVATADGLIAELESASGVRPLLLLIDDWQWADESSRRLLESLLQRPSPIRIVLAARPRQGGTAWIHGAPVIDLDPLSEELSAIVVRRWLPAADPFLVARIHAYSGGIPLYIEELCHSASAGQLARSLDRGGVIQNWLATLVAARLSRLAADDVRVVQAAAVVGNDAPLWLVRAAVALPIDPDLANRLAEADFLFPVEGGTQLRFKHGVTRDAVYEAIGLSDRRALHRKVLAALQVAHQSGDVNHQLLEALAFHADGCGDLDRAAEYAERAGDRAISVNAMDRARVLYESALRAAHRDVNDLSSVLQWVRIANKLGLACIFDPLALDGDLSHFEHAVALSRDAGHANAWSRSLYWLGYMCYGFGRFKEAKQHLVQAQALATDDGDTPLAAQVEATLGQVLAGRSEYAQALAAMDKALASKRQRSKPGSSIAIGSAYTLACKGSVLADRGEFDSAHACFDEAIGLLGGSMHPVGNSTRNWISVAYNWQGHWEQTMRVASESLRIAENTHALLLLAVSRGALGFAQWAQSGDRAGLDLLTRSVRWMTERKCSFYTSLQFGWLVEACVSEGRLADARRYASHVLWRARQGERLGEAMACRAIAIAAIDSGEEVRAWRWLQRAETSAQIRLSARESALNELARAAILRRTGRVQLADAHAEQAHRSIAAMAMRMPMRCTFEG